MNKIYNFWVKYCPLPKLFRLKPRDGMATNASAAEISQGGESAGDGSR